MVLFKMEEATFSGPVICSNNHKSETVGEPCSMRGNPEAKMLFEWGKKIFQQTNCVNLSARAQQIDVCLPRAPVLLALCLVVLDL